VDEPEARSAVHHLLRKGLPPEGSAMFEHPAYVQAGAEHEGAIPLVLEGLASVALLQDRLGLPAEYRP
jgi:hypothetical protein